VWESYKRQDLGPSRQILAASGKYLAEYKVGSNWTNFIRHAIREKVANLTPNIQRYENAPVRTQSTILQCLK
jgi:hypothetical protein